MAKFETKTLSIEPDVIALDGSNVRILLALEGGSMVHFELAAGLVSRAVAHHTVEEIWYFVEGEGVWRKRGEQATVQKADAGICGTHLPRGFYSF